jgi:hypothetical protein
VSGWAQASLFAWLLILSAVVIYATTRSDEALERVKRLEDGATRRQPEPEGVVKGAERPQERLAAPEGPRLPEPPTEALRGSGALPPPGRRPRPEPATADMRAQRPSAWQPVDTEDAEPATETNAQRRAREDEAALIAWRAEQAKRHQRRHDDPKEQSR